MQQHKLKHNFILASSSNYRLELLKQIFIEPDAVFSPDVDETSLKAENPRLYCERIARKKAEYAATIYPDSLVLAADTVISVGTRILHKPKDETEARKHLALISGRGHRAYTTLCLIGPGVNGKTHVKQSISKVKFKRLHEAEIDFYIASNQWQGCAGAYSISGYAACFISEISGSESAISGMPLYEAKNLLRQYLREDKE